MPLAIAATDVGEVRMRGNWHILISQYQPLSYSSYLYRYHYIKPIQIDLESLNLAS